jgi:hypothetical protein
MFSVCTAASAASVERDEIYAVRTDVAALQRSRRRRVRPRGYGVVVLTLQLRRS